jgi:rhodanese-related sulfurtransferase
MLVNSILKESVPYIYGKQVDINNNVILDIRTLEEYEVSPLPNAIWIGEESIELPKIEKDAKIIVYCSLGKRSELKDKQLIENGCTNVSNLYGGIIQWHNDGMTTIDSSEE